VSILFFRLSPGLALRFIDIVVPLTSTSTQRGCTLFFFQNLLPNFPHPPCCLYTEGRNGASQYYPPPYMKSSFSPFRLPFFPFPRFRSPPQFYLPHCSQMFTCLFFFFPCSHPITCPFPDSVLFTYLLSPFSPPLPSEPFRRPLSVFLLRSFVCSLSLFFFPTSFLLNRNFPSPCFSLKL